MFSDSKAIKSTFGDEHLMFSHQDFAEDVAQNPKWADYVTPFTSKLTQVKWNTTVNARYKSVKSSRPGCPFGF